MEANRRTAGVVVEPDADVTLPRIARMICDQDPDSDEFATQYADQLTRMIRHLHPTGSHLI